MITKGRPKSSNIIDRRSATKKANKTNNNNNSAGLISSRSQKGNGKANTFLTSSRTDMGDWRPRPKKTLENGDSPGRGPKGKANRNTYRTGR